MHANIWFDGACQGNPGPSGAGAVIEMDGQRTIVSEPMGVGTNNQAEYGGLIAGLKKALELGAESILVRGDSQLIIRQLEGRYAVKAPLLRPMYDEAKALLGKFRAYDLQWVRRDENGAADQAARDAVR